MSDLLQLEAGFDEISPAAGLESDRPSQICPDCNEKVTANSDLGLRIVMGKHRAKKHPGSSVFIPTKPKEEKPPREPAEPKERKSRRNGSEILTMVASGLGSLLAGVGSPAAGMALKLEAPLIGPAGDKAIAGTVVDRLALQKLLQAKGKFDQVGPLIAFPLLVALCEKQPAMRPQLYGPLRMCITPMLPQLVKAMQKQAADAEKLAQAAADLSNIDPGFAALFADGVDPVDAILGTLFAGETEQSEGGGGSQAVDDAPGG